MILNRIGAKVYHNGITYTVGDKIYANENSDYAGLYGTIFEIRDGSDKETDNDTPDIYCKFMQPVYPAERKQLEDRFSELYRSPKQISDITLDYVIMAPDMLELVTPDATQVLSMYLVKEDWVYAGDAGIEVTVVSDEHQARHSLLSLVLNELAEGRCSEWPENLRETETSPTSYACWMYEEYCNNHYKVTIEPIRVAVGSESVQEIGKQYVESQFRKHYAEQIADWEELAKLTPSQVAELFAAPEVPGRIRKHLENSDSFVDAYWESLSEAASSLVRSFLKKQCGETDG